jgi:hypothetical protein
VLFLFFKVPDARLSYLWYNVIGCMVCIVVSFIIQMMLGFGNRTSPAATA